MSVSPSRRFAYDRPVRRAHVLTNVTACCLTRGCIPIPSTNRKRTGTWDPRRAVRSSRDTTDASDVAVGAILEQDFGNGLQPIAFASRKLHQAEIRYSAYERELLGIVWAIGQWKHYFQGPEPILIQTDHATSCHLPNQASVNSRVWKWLSILQGYLYIAAR